MITPSTLSATSRACAMRTSPDAFSPPSTSIGIFNLVFALRPKKIDHALEKIRNGSFGVCEECGDPISIKRLEARLETTLCIRCKEDQERVEKDFT